MQAFSAGDPWRAYLFQISASRPAAKQDADQASRGLQGGSKTKRRPWRSARAASIRRRVRKAVAVACFGAVYGVLLGCQPPWLGASGTRDLIPKGTPVQPEQFLAELPAGCSWPWAAACGRGRTSPAGRVQCFCRLCRCSCPVLGTPASVSGSDTAQTRVPSAGQPLASARSHRAVLPGQLLPGGTVCSLQSGRCCRRPERPKARSHHPALSPSLFLGRPASASPASNSQAVIVLARFWRSSGLVSLRAAYAWPYNPHQQQQP